MAATPPSIIEPRAPDAHIEGQILVHFGGHHLFLGDVLGNPELLVLLVGRLVADIDALAARNVSIDVIVLVALGGDEHLVLRQGLSFGELGRCIGLVADKLRRCQSGFLFIDFLCGNCRTR